jgi:hypothetical protein
LRKCGSDREEETKEHYNGVAPCMKPITLKFETIEIMLSVLADQVSITSQDINITGSAYSKVQLAAPCSDYFQSSDFHV